MLMKVTLQSMISLEKSLHEADAAFFLENASDDDIITNIFDLKYF